MNSVDDILDAAYHERFRLWRRGGVVARRGTNHAFSQYPLSTLLLFVHVPRYVGMTLLVPGMVDPRLPTEFLSNAAYGDLLMAALALASIFALRSPWRFAIPLVWATNTWGFVDLLNGICGVVQLNVPSFNLSTLAIRN